MNERPPVDGPCLDESRPLEESSLDGSLPLDKSLYGQLLRYVTRRIGDAADAEDLVQHIFLKVLQSSEVPSAGEFRPWLFRVAHNAAIDAHRQRLRQRKHLPTADDVNASDVPAPNSSAESAALQARAVADAEAIGAYAAELVQALTEQDRDALTEIDLVGLSQKDYAVNRRLSYVAAKSRVQRARKRLRQELEARCELMFDARGMPIQCKPRKQGCCT